MMTAPTATKLITAAEFLEMDFDVPVELVRGEIVYPYGEDGMTRPGWRHGFVCNNVGREIGNWCGRTKLGRAANNDPGVLTTEDPDTLRGPDLFYISFERFPKSSTPSGVPRVVPNLCVEVLSPHDRWNEVRHKVNEYLDRGVSEVWVLHPETKVVHLFRADDPPSRFSEQQVLVSQELPGFECPVADLFEGA